MNSSNPYYSSILFIHMFTPRYWTGTTALTTLTASALLLACSATIAYAEVPIAVMDPTPIPSPTGKIGSLNDFVLLLIRLMMLVAVPGLVLALIWAGFLFVTARGDEKQLERAKSVFLWTMVGGAVVLGAQVLYMIAKGTVDPFVTVVGP